MFFYFIILLEKCYNLRPRSKCRKVLMSGRCAKPFWRRTCCLSCGGCGNLWSNLRCQKHIPQCGRSLLVRKRCKKACGACKNNGGKMLNDTSPDLETFVVNNSNEIEIY